MRTFAVGALFVLVGCSGYDVRIELADEGLRSEIERVQVTVIQTCSGQALGAPPVDALRSVTFDGTEGESIGELSPRSYGLYVRAVDDECTVIASGCTPINVAASGKGRLIVQAARVAGACAPDLCECGILADAGPAGDAALDVSVDALGDAGLDASTDVLIDTLVDTPPDVDSEGCERGSYEATVLADDPLLYYRLEELTPTNAVANEAGESGVTANYRGSVEGGRPSAFPALGNAVYMDSLIPAGGGGNVTLAGALPSLTEFSVEVWVHVTSPLAGGAAPRCLFVLEQYQVSGFRLYNTAPRGITYSTHQSHPDGEAVTADRSLADDEWVHVLVSVDASRARIYVDGEVEADMPSPNYVPGGTSMGFGEIQGLAGDFTVDEVAFYDAALTVEQARTHYVAAQRCRE